MIGGAQPKVLLTQNEDGNLELDKVFENIFGKTFYVQPVSAPERIHFAYLLNFGGGKTEPKNGQAMVQKVKNCPEWSKTHGPKMAPKWSKHDFTKRSKKESSNGQPRSKTGQKSGSKLVRKW